MKVFNTLFAVVAIVLVALFAISVWECRPMYAHDNSPPYGLGEVTPGGLMLLWLLLPQWLQMALLFAVACLCAWWRSSWMRWPA